MNNIFILDGQTDEVLGHINKKYVIDNEHEKDLPTHKDYFRFTVLADNKHAEHLTKRNGLIVPGEDGELLEFRIFESIKYRNNEGLFIEVHALATYLDLKTQKIFDPQKTSSETALQHATIALDGTEWQVGEINFKGTRTLTFDNPFNSYDYILRIAREFELEPRFYIETDGDKITGRYVDLVERIGEFRGRTIEFGRDLQSIKRKEDTSEVVTALWVYGPQRDDGTRLKVLVEDDEARQRWGRRGQHIIDYYEPQTENQDITEERLETLGNMELKKRINAVVTYEADIVDLENVPGMENKKIRFGDTIRIKDTKFSPPLYVEARVFNVKRDVFNKAKKTVQLGDYQEYTEEEVQAIWKQLQQQIQQKISAVQAEQMIEEYAEPKKVESPTPPPIDSEGDNPIWIDTSKEPHVPHIVEQGQWVKVVPTEAEEVNAYNKSEIDTITSDLEDGIQQAQTTADGKNSVFTQPTAPPTDGRKIGDVWFDTSRDNLMHRFDGTKWVEAKWGEQSIVANSITANHIKSLVGLNVNDQFIVDSQGNVSFAGHLEGATGSFRGEIEASGLNILPISDPISDRDILFYLEHPGGYYADGEPRYIETFVGDTPHPVLTWRATDKDGIELPLGFLVNGYITAESFKTYEGNKADIIVEQDENANGSYIRYANGIQICWTKRTVNANVASAQGSIFVSGTLTWTFPAEFISNQIAVNFSISRYGSLFPVSGADLITTTDFRYRIGAGTSGQRNNIDVHLFAMGMWK